MSFSSMNEKDILELTPSGFYCRGGDFYVDPWRPVKRAVITHGHADHARPGTEYYLSADTNEKILRLRLGPDIRLQTISAGKRIDLNGYLVSLHSAGHILGSSQVRIEHRGQVWVVSGDYKTAPDPTCAAFEPLRCHTFVTESTFGLPIFRWKAPTETLDDISRWWKENANQNRTSILFAYALGKAQRVLAGLDNDHGPIFTHGAVERVNRYYRESGVKLPPTRHVSCARGKKEFAKALVIAPSSADTPVWTKRFPVISRASASGWMQIRGNRRRRSLDQGFVLSDHADWSDILDTIRQTGAQNIWVTHGYASALVRWLKEHGLNAIQIATPLVGEAEGPKT
jgi:putative mRNA 3-end processing factor